MFLLKSARQRIGAAVSAFRHPGAVKYWNGYGGDPGVWYGGAGLSYQNRDLTFTEQGAATAYAIVAEVQRGVVFIADSIAMLPGGIYDSVTDECLIALDARDFNIYTPGATFVRAMRTYERHWLHSFFDSIVFSDWLYGETFVKRNVNPVGGVAGLRWLNPLWVEPQILSGRIQYYRYSAPNMNPDEERQIGSGDMAYRIHHRNPQNDLRGISPVLSALPSMNIGRNAERGVVNYYRNGMTLGGVMSPDTDGTMLSSPQVKQIERDMKQHHEGVDNAWRWVTVPTRMNFTTFEQPDLAKNYEVVEKASKKIMLALGVPPELAGDPSGTKYENADKVMTNWLKVNGRAYANKLSAFINTSLLPCFEPDGRCYFKFDFTTIDRQDAALVQADYNAGLIDINTARAQRGYETDPTLNDIYDWNGKPVHKSVLIQVSKDVSAFTGQPAALEPPVPVYQPGQMTLPGQVSPPPALPEPEPQKGAASLCVMLTFANNPDLIDLQKRLKTMFPDPGIKWNDPAEFHATLLYAPSVTDEQIESVVEALDINPEGMWLKVGSLACFDNVGEHALHFRIARNSDLLDMQSALHDQCKEAGLQMSGYSRPENFTPHITMGYLPENSGRIVFHGKVKVTPDDVVCSVERGGKYETVWNWHQLTEGKDSTTTGKAHTGTGSTISSYTWQIPDGVEISGDIGAVSTITLAHHDHAHTLPVITRDYSPDAALKELKAWRGFIGKKHTRPFEFVMLRGDPADEITRHMAAGDSPDTIFDALKSRFDGSRLKALEASAAALFNMMLSGSAEDVTEDAINVTVKSIGELESDFTGRFNSMLRDFRDSRPRDEGKAAGILKYMNQVFIRGAYIEGMAAGGVEDSPDDDDNVRIRELTSDANGYVNSFVSTLYSDGITDAQAAGKAGQWFKKGILPAYYAGLESAKANAIMMFSGRDGADSCPTCTKYKGKKRRMKWWTANKLRPQVDTESFECGGWECNHFLEDVTGRSDE